MAVLLLSLQLVHSHTGSAQGILDRKVSLEVHEEPLENVLNLLEQNTEVAFIYSSLADLSQHVSLQAKRQPLKEILDQLLPQAALSYEVVGKSIVIRKGAETDLLIQSPGPLILEIPGKQQELTIQGQVTDAETGESLPGVTVSLKGSPAATSTGPEGAYRLSIPAEEAKDGVLVFSFLGYLTKETLLTGRETVHAALMKDVAGLDEVVVVGYGTQKRSDITGAISSVDVRQLEGVPLRSVDQALQGRVAGVFMTQNGGQPGAGNSIRIRGGNSINGSNEPLYVIDGIPVFVSPTASTGLNPLNSISPSDIESIEVLKDASATAIYGARGGNGVVLITTKRGKAGETRINLDISTGIQQELRRYHLLDAKQFQILANEASVNDGGPLLYDPDLNPVTTDWQDLMFRSVAPVHDYRVSASGGDEKTQYLLTLGYFNQQGIMRSSDMERYSMRLNLDREVNDWVKLGSSLTFSNVQVDRVNSRSMFSMLTTPPDLPVYQPDGSYTRYNQQGVGFNNPVGLMNDYKNLNKRFRGLGNVFADISLTRGLTFKTMWALDASFQKQDTYMPQSVHSGAEVGGNASVSTNQNFIWLNENTLDFTRSFGEHRIGALAGFTQQSSRYESVNAEATGFLNDNTGSNNLGLGNPEEAILPGSSTAGWAILSWIGRVNYAFRDRYLLTVNARYDGSSRFGSNNRWGFFPSAAFAWRGIEEDFIRNLNLFSDLKIRLSYGVTGNQDGIGNYPALDLWGGVSYVLNDQYVTGITPAQIANRNLRWESTASSDIGLELGFFNNRLTLIADAYYKKTTDLLLAVSVPATSGFISGTKNIGSLENKGLEFTVNAVPVDGSFTWSSSFNISFNRNKILNLGVSDEIIPSTDEESVLLKVGEPLGNFYGFISDGLFQSMEEVQEGAQPQALPGDVRFIDFNDDGVINADDRRVMGNAQPRFYGGFSNSFSWKGFDLSVFLQFVYGNSIYNKNIVSLEGLTGQSNQRATALDRWTPENRNTIIPRATTTKPTNDPYDRYVEEGSYLRVKNVRLAYNIPVARLKPDVIQSLRVYVNTVNLFTFTGYSGMDPEANRYGNNNVLQGYDSGAYPNVRTITFGLNVGF